MCARVFMSGLFITAVVIGAEGENLAIPSTSRNDIDRDYGARGYYKYSDFVLFVH